MKTRRATPASTPSPLPRAPVVPREPWPEPGTSWHPDASRWTIGEALSHTYYLPRFQRGQAWTPEQQIALCDALWMRQAIAPIVVFQRIVHGAERRFLLDGQQRITALGGRVIRADGTQNTPTSAHLDLETGRWVVGQVAGQPPTTVGDLANLDLDVWMPRRDTPPTQDRILRLGWAASSRMGRADLVVYQLSSYATHADLVRFFRWWNTPGVQLTPDEVDALIESAREDE